MLSRNQFFFLVVSFLLALYRMSAVPSFLVGPAGAGLAASLFALKRMSAVPSFLVGPVAVVAGLVAIGTTLAVAFLVVSFFTADILLVLLRLF